MIVALFIVVVSRPLLCGFVIVTDCCDLGYLRWLLWFWFCSLRCVGFGWRLGLGVDRLFVGLFSLLLVCVACCNELTVGGL